MDIRVNSLKILSKIESITAVESSVLKVKGVVDSKIKKIDNYYKLEYAIDNWSSEYDVMVSIMETLKSEFSLESEPYVDEDYQDYNYDIQGDGESSNLEEDISFDSENISCDANNFNEDKEKHHHEHSHSHSHEHSGSMKVKLIELFVALGVFIIGVILNFIPKTEKFSQYLIVIAYSVAGYETLFEGLIGLFKGKVFSSNFLMTIASLAALILGETFEAFGIMFLFSVGELFERSATDSAQKVIDELIKLCPDTVTMLMDGVEKKVNVKQVEVGATVVLKAGDKVALDGKIISGSASFDSKAVTGESKLKDLCEDDLVFGGYVNLNGYVLVEVLKDYKNSTINKIMEIVESSYEKKSKKESFIEKFAKWYTPCVLVLALLIAFIPPIFSASYSAGLSVWGVRAIMLICVSCPCALGLATPVAVT
ncbi:MAG: HAD-IC family P-type ATPase, partial [Clostridia bacterium]|nr:HAD-IC family P-type ATPase [Clostridia bacterium]